MGEVGFTVDVGRPGVGATFQDVEKISMAVAEVGVEFEQMNLVTKLMTDRTTDRIRDDVKKERILSCILEFKTKDTKILSVVNALVDVSKLVNTVFSVVCICRCRPDGTMPVNNHFPGIAENILKAFIKFAPKDFDIAFIGISSNYKKRPLNRWMKLCLGGRKFIFFPLFLEKNENKKTVIPLSLRFTLALKYSNVEIDKKILFFNRIEPALIFKKVETPKIGLIHSDIMNQLTKGKSSNTLN